MHKKYFDIRLVFVRQLGNTDFSQKMEFILLDAVEKYGLNSETILHNYLE